MSAPEQSQVLPNDLPGAGEGWASHERFLAEAGRVLAQSLDYQDTLARVARLAVPTFADWCFIDLLSDEEQSSFDRVAVGHDRLDGGEIARALLRRYPLQRGEPVGVSVAMLERKPLLLRDIDAALPRSLARDEVHLAALTDLREARCG